MVIRIQALVALIYCLLNIISRSKLRYSDLNQRILIQSLWPFNTALYIKPKMSGASLQSLADSLALMDKYSTTLVHRSIESLVISIGHLSQNVKSPSVEWDSIIFSDEDYQELEHVERSPIKITRAMETLVLWFLQLPQRRVHIRVCHSWSEESPEENFPYDM